MVTHLIFWGIAKLFSKTFAPVYNPTSNKWRCQFLHILSNSICFFIYLFCCFCAFCCVSIFAFIYIYVYFYFCQPSEGKVVLNMLLTSISQMTNEAEYIFMSFLDVCIPYSEKSLFKFNLLKFKNWTVTFCYVARGLYICWM